MSGDDLEFGAREDFAASITPSIADAIRGDIAQRREETEWLTHPSAPAWSLLFVLPKDRSLINPIVARAEAAAKEARAKKRQSTFPFEAAVLARCNRGVRFQGEILTGDAGMLTVRDPELREALGAAEPSDAIRAIYSSDGAVEAVFDNLMNLAGYRTSDEVIAGDEDGEPDPTNAG